MTDLHMSSARADEREAAAIAALLGDSGPAVAHDGDRVAVAGRARAATRRRLLLPGLWALQDAAGWISPGGLNSLCLALGVAPADAYGVATFYSLFCTEPTTRVVVRRCDDIGCRIHPEIPLDGENEGVERRHSPCLGQCDHGAAALVQRHGRAVEVLTSDTGAAPVVDGGVQPRLLRRALAGAHDLDRCRSLGGFEALEQARRLAPQALIDRIRSSGLRGRGGAAFPAGDKWQAVAEQAAAAKHVIANADESEPGTFKDRVLMERDPFGLVEALAICGHAVGAQRGWIYVRGEYPLAYERLGQAVAATHAAGLLGDFTVEVRRGAGAYICGEETALLESLEGRRGEPRNKPPYPTTHGLFGAPTVINNVETLFNVIDIVREGADAWRAIGTDESPGTRLFCLSGHVERPGVYEHPLGISLRDAIDAAGGVRSGRSLQAVLLGGAAGVLVRPTQLDIELSFEGARAAGVTLGSGAIMLFDDTVDLRQILIRTAAFFAHESCGQCVPCRIGTQRQLEELQSTAPDPARLDDLDRVMTDASICGLGQSAASLVRSARQAGLL
jgi:NADH-quinone oxidoreductase subunit F